MSLTRRPWGLGVLGFLPEYLGKAEDHNIGLRALLTYPFGLTGELARAVAIALFFGLMAGAVAWIGRANGGNAAGRHARAPSQSPPTSLLVPTSMHPWYVLWMVPFLCFRRWPAWLYFSGAVTLSYMSYVVEPAPMPWWAWLAEYGPLYALLLHAAWRARAQRGPGGAGTEGDMSVVVGILYGVAVVALFLYGLNAYHLLAIHWWNRRRIQEAVPPEPPAEWPSVTVQLPLYNERYVARRLLEAVGAFDYPSDRLEIQVLDDSTDDTGAIIASSASQLRARGLTVVHLHRRERTGFKAGALAAGLKEARGEFVAIFDADSVPEPDFLRRTLPHFTEPRVAVVQTRWGHLNRDFSLLTVAQALGIDGHFAVEQSARFWGNLLLNFNGTAGVWRKAAIEDSGRLGTRHADRGPRPELSRAAARMAHRLPPRSGVSGGAAGPDHGIQVPAAPLGQRVDPDRPQAPARGRARPPLAVGQVPGLHPPDLLHDPSRHADRRPPLGPPA